MIYSLDFTDEAKLGISKIKKSGDQSLIKKLTKILLQLSENPMIGDGKPELLKHYSEPTWSRRISSKHRLVYRIQEEKVNILILSSWGHYDDK